MNRQRLLYLAFGLTVLAVAAFIYLNREPSPHPALDGTALVAASSAQAPASEAPRSLPGSGNDLERALERIKEAAATHPSQTERVDPAKYNQGPKQPYAKEIIGIAMRLDLSNEDKVRQLLSKIGSLPHDGKVLAMEEATKLIPDEQYNQYRPTLFALVSSNELRETVLLDVLTRGEPVRMPTLVEMLKQPPNTEHPAHEDIREILVAYLDTDYGSNLDGWDSAVKKFLADNPDL
jgi:hypothetical protein